MRVMILIVVASTLLPVSIAAADTITTGCGIGCLGFLTHDGTSATTTGSDAVPNSVLFDPTLGLLNSVMFNHVGSLVVRKSLVVQPGLYQVTAEVDIQISTPGGFDYSWSGFVATGATNVTAAGLYEFSEGDSLGGIVTIGDSFDVFVSGGQLDFSMSGRIMVTDSGGGTVYSGLGDTMTGSSRFGDYVTYDYTPVPEPGTVVLVGFGLACTGARSRPSMGPRSPVVGDTSRAPHRQPTV